MSHEEHASNFCPSFCNLVSSLSSDQSAETYLVPPSLVADLTIEEPRLILVHLDVAVLTAPSSSGLGLRKGLSSKGSSSASTTIRRLIRPLDLVFVFVFVLIPTSITDRSRKFIAFCT